MVFEAIPKFFVVKLGCFSDFRNVKICVQSVVGNIRWSIGYETEGF